MGYDCQMTTLGDCLRVKRYGREIPEESGKSKRERLAEIEAIYANRSLTDEQKQVYSAILKPPDREESAIHRPDRTPKPGRLSLKE
ncbi:hypothetical protein FE784_24350 [Paenibacillus hemerocallicola]|uniref:Uncharacterized protein n=1 Tax=Paenibacillus hemerocallicola TaxID=1172614 RepID=A0A5C4T3H7_9BACL|nr:hypothetical protein [Paenibacillus hemerocallicola]TNJ63593.1 hypothetical protein FE784_24350 [Paenibacillus hemerocallicola]